MPFGTLYKVITLKLHILRAIFKSQLYLIFDME